MSTNIRRYRQLIFLRAIKMVATKLSTVVNESKYGYDAGSGNVTGNRIERFLMRYAKIKVKTIVINP